MEDLLGLQVNLEVLEIQDRLANLVNQELLA